MGFAGLTGDEIRNMEQIYIVACGSAWHVGMEAQYVIEELAEIPVRVELASEFRYRKMPPSHTRGNNRGTVQLLYF